MGAPMAERLASYCRRHPCVALAAVVVLALATGVVWSLMDLSNAPKQVILYERF